MHHSVIEPKFITYKQALALGYIDDYGYVRCYFCNADRTQLTEKDCYYEDIGGHYEVVEYTACCQKCGQIQGGWAYGAIDPCYVREEYSWRIKKGSCSVPRGHWIQNSHPLYKFNNI